MDEAKSTNNKNLKPFTKLSLKAIEGDGVCWNYTCTTCGCRKFMDLMVEISGLDIEKFDRYGQRNKLLDQKSILNFYREIDIKELLANAKFPDFLGHMGLLFYSCEVYRTLDKEIASSIVTQINELTNFKLPESIFNGGKRLKFEDLRHIESFLENYYFQK